MGDLQHARLTLGESMNQGARQWQRLQLLQGGGGASALIEYRVELLQHFGKAPAAR